MENITASSKKSFIQNSSKKRKINEANSSNSKCDKKEKVPFDKRKWREKKYSNKYKLDQWENSRKKKVLNEYYKVKDESRGFDVKKIYEENDSDPESQPKNIENSEVEKAETPKRKPKLRAIQEFNRLKEEKVKKKEELAKKKAEREEALKVYRQKKLEKYKLLNKKTKKGQPVMKHRLEMLLEKIQKSCSQD